MTKRKVLKECPQKHLTLLLLALWRALPSEILLRNFCWKLLFSQFGIVTEAGWFSNFNFVSFMTKKVPHVLEI
jgi:hypothetical protein